MKRLVRSRLLAPCVSAFILLAWSHGPGSPACRAQQPASATLSVEGGASYSVPPAGGSGEASEYLHGGLRLAGPPTGQSFWHIGAYGGLGLRTEASSWASILGGGGFRVDLGSSVAVGLALTGEAFRVGEPFPYDAATARIEPDVTVRRGATMVRLGLQGGLGTSTVTTLDTLFRDTRFGRTRIRAGTDVTTDLWSLGGSLEARHRLGTLTPWLGLEAYDSPQGRYLAARLGAEVVFDAGSIAIEATVWDTPYGEEASLVAVVWLLPSERSGIAVTGGRYGPDPLLDAPPAGGAGATVRWEVVRFGMPADLEIQISELPRPRVLLRLREPTAERVQVVGEFTDWSPVSMERTGGEWTVELSVEAGTYRFGFLIDGVWTVPESAPGRGRDEWGSEHAILVVAGDPEP